MVTTGPRVGKGKPSSGSPSSAEKSSEAAAPMAAVMKRALDRGLYLMTHWNVIMVCPPLTITRDEIDEGIGILDEALSIADEYTA